MADSDKNIHIYPMRGSTSQPKVDFTGYDNNTVTLTVLDDGTLSFDGSSGQLFSISDSLTGTIFSVNDVSGIPSIEVEDDGTITLGEFAGNVIIGAGADDGNKLQVNGSATFTGQVTFPGAIASRPILQNGFIGMASGDADVDIWGISEEYYPSHGTAANTWGIKWASSPNQVQFVGNGTNRLVVDLDGGNSGLTWEGNTVWHAGNDGSGSGLDADTVDGQHESTFMRRSANSDLDMNGYYIYDVDRIETQGENKDVKFSVWTGTTYGVGMTSGVTFGGLNDYAMTFCMNNESDRGFWWGYSGQSKSSGAMSLTTSGHLYVNSRVDADLFFDKADTAWYLDPAGISVLSHIWFPDGKGVRFGNTSTDFDSDITSYSNQNFGIEETHFRCRKNDLSLSTLADDEHINFYSNGGNSSINLYASNSNGIGNALYIKCDGSDKKTKLYYVGTQKLETTSAGITVTGTVTTDNVTVGGVDVKAHAMVMAHLFG